MKKIINMIVIIALIMMPATNYAAAPKNLFILVDLSDSSPHLRIPQFARKSAAYVDRYLSGLSLGSTIHFITFGEYDMAKNSLSLSRTILNRKGHRLKDVRLIMKKIINALPELVEKKKLKLQTETSIIAALKTLRQRLDLNQNNNIILLSDMLEFSAEANAYRLIKQKNGHLPKPKHSYLKDVKIHALGAGIGTKNSYQNERLENLWWEYFSESGVTKFVYLTDF